MVRAQPPVVYCAFDPQLDRKVALQLLPSAGDDETSDAEPVETPLRARASEIREQLRRRGACR